MKQPFRFSLTISSKYPLALLLVLVLSCQKSIEPTFDNPYDEQSENYIPFADLSTNTATSITAISAVSGGVFTNDYGKPVTQKGSCWSLTTEPTLDDSCSQDGSGLDPFTSNLSELVADTTYYIRAYATNADGVTYGDEKSFSTLSGRPTVGQVTITDITALSVAVTLQVTDDGGAAISDRGLCWRLVSSPISEQSCISSGEGTGSVQHTLTNLQAGTDYFTYGYATNQVTTVYGSETEFLTRDGVIAFGTLSVSDVTVNGARIGVSIQDDGGSVIFQRGICYALTENPDLDDSCVQSGEGLGSYSIDLNNLQPGTTYYVRAYATNQIGSGFGDQMTFTTGTTPPRVNTIEVSGISTTSATISGDVTTEGSATVTNRGICFSVSQLPTLETNCIQSGSGVGWFSVIITDLTPGQVYYVRAYAISNVATVYGGQLSFTTGTALPSVTTTEISNVLTNRATVSGNVNNPGTSPVTSRGICASTTQNPTTSDRCVTAGSGTGPFTVIVTLLESGTRYYVRSFATSNVGTSYGNELSFVTGTTAPTVTTGTTSNITTSSVTISGNVTNSGTSSVSTRGICYSRSQNPTTAGSCVNAGSGTGAYSANITGLNAGTLYYARAFATSSVGTSYGSQITFTTSSLTPPTVSTGSVTNITSSTATVSGTVTNSGSSSVSSRGVCYSTGQNPTTSDSCVNSGSGTGSFSVNISGLRASTTYYVRAYAASNVGTSYGVQRSFSTSAAPTTQNWTFVSYFPDETTVNSAHGIVVDNSNKVWIAPYYSELINNDTERVNRLVIWNENGSLASISGIKGTVTGDSLLRFGPLSGINKGPDGNIYVSSHGFRHTANTIGAVTGGVWNQSRSFIHVINPTTGQGIRVIEVTRMRTETASHSPNRPAVTASGHVFISYVFQDSPILQFNTNNNWSLVRTVTNSIAGFSRTLEVNADGSKIVIPTSEGVYVYQGSTQSGYSSPSLFNSNIFSGAVARDPLEDDVVYLSGAGIGNDPDAISPFNSNTYYGFSLNSRDVKNSFTWSYGSDTIYRIPRGIAFSPDGRYAYVVSFTAGNKNIQKFRRD